MLLGGIGFFVIEDLIKYTEGKGDRKITETYRNSVKRSFKKEGLSFS